MIPNDATEVVPYVTSAATIAYIQRWLKSKDVYHRFVKAFPGTDKWAHWAVAGFASLIAAAGIHWVWNGTMTEGGTLTIQIPSAVILAHGMADWFKVYILQHTIHDATKNKETGL